MTEKAESSPASNSPHLTEALHKNQPPGPATETQSLRESQLDLATLQRAAANPQAARPSSILHLQRRIGNQALLQLLGHRPAQRAPGPVGSLIQAKLLVTAPYDNHEAEAERVANHVMSMPATPSTPLQRLSITPLAQRRALRHPVVHRLAQPRRDEGFESSDAFEQRLNQSRGGGSPLPAPTRSFMEERFGADFGQVRVHTGSEAVQLSREVSAQAFTHGSDIYFGAGRFDPDSHAGKHLLAHELTHTLQQGGSSGQAQRLIQRRPTVKELIYAQLALPKSGSKALSKVGSAVGSVAGSVASGVADLSVKAVGLAAIELLHQVTGWKRGSIVMVTSALKLLSSAYNMWIKLPSHYQALIYYVAGSAYLAVARWITSNENLAPPDFFVTDRIQDRSVLASLMGGFEAARKTLSEAVSAPHLAVFQWISGRENPFLRWLSQWSEAPVESVPSPRIREAESAQSRPAPVELGPSGLGAKVASPALKESFKPGASLDAPSDDLDSILDQALAEFDEQSPPPSSASPERPDFNATIQDAVRMLSEGASLDAPQRRDASPAQALAQPGQSPEPDASQAGPLGRLKLPFITLNLLKMDTVKKSKEEQEKQEKPGGLRIKTGLEFDLFGMRLGQDGEEIETDITLPWGLTGTPHFNLAASNIKFKGIDTAWFDVLGISLKSIEIDNDGLKKADVEIQKLSVGNSVVGENLEATWSKDKKELIFTSKTLKINLYGYGAEASGFTLKLDANGEFVSGELGKMKGDAFSLDEVKLDKKGFTLKKAELALPEALNGTKITFGDIAIKKGQPITGQGTITVDNLELVKDRFFIKKAKFTGEMTKDGWSITVGGTPTVALGDSATNLHFEGDFKVTYKKGMGDGEFVGDGEGGEELKNGALRANLADVVAFNSEGISYKSKSKTFKVKKAKLGLNLAKIGLSSAEKKLEKEAEGIVLSPEGLDFDRIKLGGEEDIKLVTGVALNKPSVELSKQGTRYTLKGKSGLTVKRSQPSVEGEASGIELEFIKSGDQQTASAKLTSLRLKSSWFTLMVNGGKLNKDGLEIESAALIRDKARGGSEPDYGLSAEQLGKFDLPVRTEWGFVAKGIKIDEDGLTIKEVDSNLKKIDIRLFGVEGGVDFGDEAAGEAAKAYLKGGFKFPPETPLWPMELRVFFPVQPWLEVSGSLGVGGHVAADLDLTGSATKQASGWKLGFQGGPSLKGVLTPHASLGLSLGSSVLASLGAELSLKAPINIDTKGKVQGGVIFDPKNKEKRFTPDKDFAIDYGVEQNLSVELGADIKARFFYFFSKTLYTVTFKKWELGSFTFAGKIRADQDGNLKVEQNEATWKFLGKDKGDKPSPPTTEGENLFTELDKLEAILDRAGSKLLALKKQPKPVTVWEKMKGAVKRNYPEKQKNYIKRLRELYIEGEISLTELAEESQKRQKKLEEQLLQQAEEPKKEQLRAKVHFEKSWRESMEKQYKERIKARVVPGYEVPASLPKESAAKKASAKHIAANMIAKAEKDAEEAVAAQPQGSSNKSRVKFSLLDNIKAFLERIFKGKKEQLVREEYLLEELAKEEAKGLSSSPATVPEGQEEALRVVRGED